MTRNKFDFEEWEKNHKAHIGKYLSEIDKLYDAYILQLTKEGISYDYDPSTGKPFAFSKLKNKEKAINSKLSSFSNTLHEIIVSGITAEWEFSNAKNDAWVNSLFSFPEKKYLQRNIEAQNAFKSRKIYGYTISDRVWNYTKLFKEQIELALSIGIKEGKSAQELSRDIRGYLNKPDDLYRRIKDEFSNLVLSKKAKSYHPGQGIYRSSYKNAVKLARTEINMAYREADSLRWQQLDFVVGIRVRTSKTHPKWLAIDWYPRFKKGQAPIEICNAMEGNYPKDFKFIGWHPNCQCYAVPILANEGTEQDWWDTPVNIVRYVPEGYQKWINSKEQEIEGAKKRGKLPYWIVENPKYSRL